jgi:hypothetical protein
MNAKEMVDDIVIIYPEGFSDFSTATKIGKNQTLHWIEDVVQAIQKKVKNNDLLNEVHSTISSGNTKVFIEAYRQNNDEFTVCVTVAQNYKHKIYYDIKLKENI